MIISDEVRDKVHHKGIQVFFVPRAATKWWNARRKDRKTEIALLGGWYWALGSEERGPFRTQSGAWRDAYYRRILGQRPPLMDQQELRLAAADAKAQQRKAKRRVSKHDNVVRLVVAA